MTKRNSNVYEFDPKKKRRSKARMAADRSRRNPNKKPGGTYKGYENLVRNRRLKAFGIFLVIVIAYVLARPVLSGLVLVR